ncbi:MAG TPA: DUF4157 domain-containing protein [Silvibacterium sp.]|nr:DUF4157 domain-containing protein [Silvibacterium sp.]
MSRAALMLDTESPQGSKSSRVSGSLRVSKPGDSFETEAERVAETVSRGGKISRSSDVSPASWSFSKLDVNHVQRDGDKPAVQGPGPKPNNYDEALGKIAEAFLKTDLGRQITDAAQKDPVVKGVEGFVDTLPGKIVAGAAATGVVSALAATHQPLPAQIPAIPLDKVKPGLSVKITYEGPVDHPKAASITFSFAPKAAEDKKKPSPKEQRLSETARMAADLYKFREGLKTEQERKLEAAEAQQALDFALRRPGLGTGGIDVSKYSYPNLAPAPPAGPQLTPPQFQSPLAPKTPTLLDKKLELKPLSGPSSQLTKPDAEGKKKEELTVLRKAERAEPLYFDTAEVESVVASPGRLLDPETRRHMESHIGFDFSKVRVHTDDRASASARGLGAKAYTLGNHVVFASGRYAPKTAEGRRLLAHELTHVVQQSPTLAPRPVGIGRAPSKVQRLLEEAKEWLLGKLKGSAWYPLFCLVIGQDLVTKQPVERNATNVIQAVLGLFDGGPALFEKLKKAANALENAYQWVLKQFTELQLLPEDFFKLIDRAYDAFDKWHPFESWDRAKAIFKEPLDRLIELASRLGKAVLDFILQGVLENFPLGKQVYQLLKKAGAVISRIAADPISFAKNLLAAIKQGFKSFGDNILTHLGDGLKKWIFEEIGLSDIKIPEKFDFTSILKLILQVLKLTYEQRRPQLVEKLGEQVVYFFETAVDVFTKIKNQGLVAVWEDIKKQASDLLDTVIEKARNWVVEQIVKLGLVKVIALANPVGEVIEVIADIYETIKFFIEKATKFVQLIDSIVQSFADMVDGKIDAAAKKVEDTLAGSIPLILRFLAGLLHLEGIGEAIRKIIEAIRKPIDDAIGKVLDFLVDKFKPIWEKGKEAFLGKLAAVKEWWKKPKKFRYGEEEHELVIEGDGDHPQVFVQSNKTALEHFLSDVKAKSEQKKEILRLAGQLRWRQGELQKPADDEKGAKTFDKLKDAMDRLKARQAPPSKLVKEQTTLSLGGGEKADVFLSSNRNLGTEPGGTDPPIWNDLGEKLRKDKSYVRGHLLSMRLGGLGQWKNMMPITNTVNQRMNSQVEAPLKKATTGGSNRYFHYVVEAKYADNVLPPLPDKATAKEQRARGLEAEKRLLKLSWKVTPAEYDEKTGWKETTGDLLDVDGSKLKINADGGFEPPTITA